MNRSLPLTFSFLAFVTLTSIFAFYAPLISDEIHEAATVYDLLKIFPYKDEIYYKNVLGYFLKYPIIRLPFDWLTVLRISRVILGLCYSGMIFFVIRDHFKKGKNPLAISCAAIITLFMTQNLLHAASYRVDLLTTIFGFFSFYCLKKGKFNMAGLLAAISFLISQKGIWFCASGFLCLLIVTKDSKALISYLRSGILSGLAYILFFGAFSSIETVLYGIFLKDAEMATSAGYSIRHFWSQTFFENTVYWLVSFFGFSTLFVSPLTKEEKLLALYTALLTLFLFINPQSWPYNFIYLSPFYLYLQADFFSTLLERKKLTIAIVIVCIGSILSIFQLFKAHTFSNKAQVFNIRLLDEILGPKDTYLAGFNLFPKSQHKQAHEEFNWLHAIQRAHLRNLPVVDLTRLINELRENPPKAILKNYRFQDLPPMLNQFFTENYNHYWGNIATYTVPLSKDSDKGKGNANPNNKDNETLIFQTHFKGNYIFLGLNPDSAIQLEGSDKLYKVGDSLNLEVGIHKIKKSPYKGKLVFFPGRKKLPTSYRKEQSLNFTYN